MPPQYSSAFISNRALAARWACSERNARATMERNGFTRIPWGSRSQRWRMADVEALEMGGGHKSILGQLAAELKEREATRRY